jgi:hypothetical protein
MAAIVGVVRIICARSYHFLIAVRRAKEAGSNPMAIKKKKKGYGLEIKTFRAATMHPIWYFGLEKVHSMCLWKSKPKKLHVNAVQHVRERRGRCGAIFGVNNQIKSGAWNTGKSSQTDSAKPVEVGAASQPWIATGGQSGLQTHIATTESVSLRTPMKS